MNSSDVIEYHISGMSLEAVDIRSILIARRRILIGGYLGDRMVINVTMH